MEVDFYDTSYIGKTIIYENKLEGYIIHVEITDIVSSSEAKGTILWINDKAAERGNSYWNIGRNTDGWGLQSEWTRTILEPEITVDTLLAELNKLENKLKS